MKRFIFSLAVCALAVLSNEASGSIIGQWTGSTRSWNDSGFTTINNTLTSAGHTIEADGGITAAELANDDIFMIGEASTSLSAAETADLSSWVSNGGILWISVDSNSNELISNSISVSYTHLTLPTILLV